MKPDPYVPPLPRRLTEEERLILRCSSTGGRHAIRPVGVRQWRSAKALKTMGLGEIAEGRFTPSLAGEAAVRHLIRH